MYQYGAPVVGGLASVTVLATTGAEALATAVVGIVTLVAGLLLLRVAVLRRRRRAREATADGG